MKRRHSLSRSWTLVSVLLAVTACTPTVPIGTPTSVPTASPGPSAQPSVPASPKPSDRPSATNPIGSATPSAIPSTSGSDAKVAIRGIVFDDTAGRVDGASISVRVLGAGAFANGSDVLVTTTNVGAYGFTGVPVGTTVAITVAKPGMTTRTRTLVPVVPTNDKPDINTTDFGAGTDIVTAMSDKPEIIRVSPTLNARGIDPATSFTLTFNEPMNKTDVENAFIVLVSGDNVELPGSPTRTDQIPLTAGPNLITGFLAKKDDGLKRDYTEIIPYTNRFLYDSTAFNPVWSKNDTEVTFSFKPGNHLPVDKDPTRIPSFVVSFRDRRIGDAGGAGVRDKSWFRLQPSVIGRYGYSFKPANDEVLPRIVSVRPLNRDEVGGAATEDRILVQFNKTMMIYPSNLPDRDGPAGPAASDQSIPDGTNDSNHILNRFLFQYETAALKPAIFPARTPQLAKLYTTDTTRATVELQPVAGSGVVGGSFTTGDNVWLKVNAALQDPAGNVVESTNDSNYTNGFSQ